MSRLQPKLSFDLTVAKPCTQEWSSMAGTASQRHCASCNKKVHNLAALTPRQIQRLADQDGDICARITYRHDGSLVTARSATSNPRAALLTLSAAFAATSPMFAQVTDANTPAATQSDQPVIFKPSVFGTLTDSQGALVVGGTISLIQGGKSVGSAINNDQGEFLIYAPPGIYVLEASAQSFAPSTLPLTLDATNASPRTIALTPGTSTTVNVTSVHNGDYTTMGAMVATITTRRDRLLYRLRHPVRYFKYLTPSH